MSFRQFPAIGADGEPYVIIEFRDEHASTSETHAAPRYELPDGRHLQRQGQRFVTEGGELQLSMP
ncbi:hypothetical protein FHR47_002014 [Xanthomonas arboricola]|uniref:hypothetical protein n=1 Tax=Xanthomonas cannabis TaxID=1885674 RepID=UPI00141AF0B1|nr:hypothetical protein [Xanthomonas cannabis]MBB3801766.1 hypothetical protein [Xanthomonas cannabis]MBB3806155.1 hypothetical protein [Xanthomonas cannabis]NIK01755.1 hypothetical protein [Xanthomonas cannabis]NIK19908.1 hypothetical protein [Xanthomonas cannabis]NIK62868.1 hypothetical protein [Xanthomonas cannabis]